MPYKLSGTTIFSKATGTWKKKQKCGSVAAAKRALGLLHGLESGSITKKDLAKRKKAKKGKKSK